MNELKKSPYKDVKAAVIASRDQHCIHPNLANFSNIDKIHNCAMLRRCPSDEIESEEEEESDTNTNSESPKYCKYFNNVESSLGKLQPDPILDIEDLRRFGDTHDSCPYYVSKQRIEHAEILFMPYNYLIEPKLRKTNEINLQNSIVIIDEGHNIGKMCEDIASTSIKSSNVRNAILDLEHVCSIFE